MKNRFFLFCLMAVMTVSCAKEQQEVIQTVTDDPVFHATIENAGTRVFADDQLRVLWNADDRVSIFNKTTFNRQYRFMGEDGANAGSFTKVPSDDFVTSNPLEYVYSVYPYNENTCISNDGEITVYLPAEQTYREDSFGLGANTMIAITEDDELMFKNLCGYFAVKLYGDNVSVKSITLKGNDNEQLSGKATVVASIDEAPALTFDTAVASEMITLTPESPVTIGSTEETATTFWFVVPPTTFNDGITLSVTDQNDGSFVKTTTGSLVISRNRLKNTAALKVETGSSSGDDKVYERISEARFVTEGAQFVMATAADDLSYGLSATQGSDFRLGVPVTKSHSGAKAGEGVETIVNPSDDVEVLTVEAGTKEGVYAFKTKAGKYLAVDASKSSALLSIDSKTTMSDWRIKYKDGDCSFECVTPSYTYGLRYRKNDNKFLAFRPSFVAANQPIALYKLEGSGGSDWKLDPDLHLSKTSLTLTEGDTQRLAVALCYSLSDGGVVTFSSSDPTIATVDDNGNVTAVKAGETTITATVGETDNYKAGTATCQVTVLAAIVQPEAVDLGLPSGLKWASFNIGATKPEECGEHFAWGETESYYTSLDPLTWKAGKEHGYDWASYSLCMGESDALTKYCTSYYGYNGYSDGKTVLEPVDDAAVKAYGGTWRMPTDVDWNELRTSCTWEMTRINGVVGCKITASNGKSIFLPAAGYLFGFNHFNGDNFGYYWSSKRYSISDRAHYIYFTYGDFTLKDFGRCRGLSVRAVCP